MVETQHCSCGALYDAVEPEEPSPCPGCGEAYGAAPRDSSQVLVQVGERRLPQWLWEAEIYVNGARWLLLCRALAAAVLCGASALLMVPPENPPKFTPTAVVHHPELLAIAAVYAFFFVLIGLRVPGVRWAVAAGEVACLWIARRCLLGTTRPEEDILFGAGVWAWVPLAAQNVFVILALCQPRSVAVFRTCYSYQPLMPLSEQRPSPPRPRTFYSMCLVVVLLVLHSIGWALLGLLLALSSRLGWLG